MFLFLSFIMISVIINIIIFQEESMQVQDVAEEEDDEDLSKI